MSNSISISMHIGSGKNAINNLEKIKRCDLHNNRKYKNNRNEQIDLSLSKYNITIAGTKNITTDIKEFYKKEFAEATYNYNKNQKDERRKIADYLTKMDKDSKSNIATEFIFQIGDKEDWENKSLEDKQKTVEIFKKAIPILEDKGIKTVNASLHLDETSPHLHLIAVPIITGQKRGLEKQVSQNKIITKEIIKEIRSKVEKVFIEEYNKVFNDNKTLKKGCEIEEHLQIEDYKNVKKVIEIAKKIGDKEILKEKANEDLKKVSTDLLKVSEEIEKLEKEKNEKDNIKKNLEDEVKNIDVKNKEYKEKLDKNKNNLEVSTANITKEIKELESKNIEIKKLKEEKEREFEKEFLYKANKIKEIEDLKKEIEEKEIELKELEERKKAEEKKKNDFITEEKERKKRDEAIEKAIADDKEKLKIKQEEQAKIKKELENIENTRIKIENDIKAALVEKEKEENTLKTINKNIEKIKEDIETAIKNKEKLEKEKQEIEYTKEDAIKEIIELIEKEKYELSIMDIRDKIDNFIYNKNNKILNLISEEIKSILPNITENVDGYKMIVPEKFRENIENRFGKFENTKSINKNNNSDDIEY